MNKKIYTIASLALFGLMVAANYASAATFQFSPANFNVTAGQTFTVTVALNPEGVKNYTSKMVVGFPSDILQVNSFTYANSWMPITSSGYDSVDNTNGVLTKTAGYPGGTANPVTFGTISFTAKKAGSGAVAITSQSLVLSNTGQNLLSAFAQSQVVVNAASVNNNNNTKPATNSNNTNVNTGSTQAITTPQGTGTATASVTPTGTSDATAVPQTASVSNAAGSTSFLASMVNVFSFGTNNSWIAFISLIVLIGVGWYLINYFVKQNSKSE